MTFLIDENLSNRLKAALAGKFPDCKHVADVNLLHADDRVVWASARSAGLALLSKDDDLRQIVEMEGPPPKLVWLRLGNVSTAHIAEVLLARAPQISAFLAASGEEGVFTINP